MHTRQLKGIDIQTSLLGFGCMRLPLSEAGNDKAIDRPEAIRMIRHAIDNGVNYIDTAYGYHGGQSEGLVGEALEDGYREKVYLATKLPVWHVKKPEDMERLLDEQLARLGVPYVDFYLLHAVGGESFRRVKEMGALSFLDEMVKKGKIRYPSFSFHDDHKAFIEIVDAYDWKMAQVQLNILDEENQATLEGVRYAAGKGINIVVMEPLRGGSLAGSPPPNVKALYDGFAQKRTPVEWAMRYLYDMPEVMCILSGMSNMEQVQDNLRIFSADCAPGSMSEAEHELIEEVRKAYQANVRVGCTGCNYCMPCPFGVDIPGNFRFYDECSMFGNMERYEGHYANLSKEDKQASMCQKCGACEPQCPQNIPIIAKLEEIAAAYGA